MSANADSVRFERVCNVHVCAYFEILPVSGKTYFLQNMAYGRGQDISRIKSLVVIDFDTLFK